MKPKQLLTLVVLAVVIGALAYMSQQRDQQRSRPSDRIGKIVFPGLPINDIQKLVVIQAGSTSVVARTPDGKWGVPNRWNYPADFTKVADTLVMLSELKVQQVLQATPKQLASFKLQAPDAAADASEAGSEVRLLGARDEILLSFLVGKERMRQVPAGAGGNPMMNYGPYPDGQYIRQAAGPILLVSGRLGDLADTSRRWIAADFLSLPAADVMDMTVAGPDRAEIKVARMAQGESFVLSGVSTNQDVDDAKLNQMTGAFSYLGFEDVADPKLSADELGLSKPIRVTTRTRDNRTYVLDIGRPVSESNPDRYVKVANSFVALPQTNAPTDAKLDEAARKAQDEERKAREEDSARLAQEAASFNERMTNWVFIIKSSRVDPLLVKKDDLIKAQPVATNVPEKAVSAPVPMVKESVEKK